MQNLCNATSGKRDLLLRETPVFCLCAFHIKERIWNACDVTIRSLNDANAAVKAMGYDTVAVSSAEEGLGILEKGGIDLVMQAFHNSSSPM